MELRISGDLLPGNHVSRGAGNLMRPSQIHGARNLEAPADFEHGDDVAERNALKQPQTGRSDIDGALGIIDEDWACRDVVPPMSE